MAIESEAELLQVYLLRKQAGLPFDRKTHPGVVRGSPAYSELLRIFRQQDAEEAAKDSRSAEQKTADLSQALSWLQAKYREHLKTRNGDQIYDANGPREPTAAERCFAYVQMETLDAYLLSLNGNLTHILKACKKAKWISEAGELAPFGRVDKYYWIHPEVMYARVDLLPPFQNVQAPIRQERQELLAGAGQA